MLSASSSRTFGSSSLKTTIFLERRMRAHLVCRDRLLYDSTYAPPGRKSGDWAHLFVNLRGWMSVDGGAAIAAPCAFVLAETEFDRVEPSAKKFRSWGAPAEIVEIRLGPNDIKRPIGLAHGAIELPAPVLAAYAELWRTQGERELHALMVQLAEANVVTKELTASIVTKEPERYERIWKALKPFYSDLAMSTSLKQLAVIAGLSLRQLGRDFGDFTRDFGLFGGGFRDATRVLRLRAAVVFLSSPGATPSDVARAVGYGSLDAMGRAFRDAKLPAPSVVQEAVRYPDQM